MESLFILLSDPSSELVSVGMLFMIGITISSNKWGKIARKYKKPEKSLVLKWVPRNVIENPTYMWPDSIQSQENNATNEMCLSNQFMWLELCI